MKYILTIDAEKKEVSVSLDRPIFLRTGDESPMELARRKRIISEYEKVNLPDWLHDEVVIIQKKLELRVAE
ncbi:hypothetical protein MASR2M70_17100 [Bacillota bacterium]